MVFLFYRLSVVGARGCWTLRSAWLIFMKACIGRQVQLQHGARVSARCSWTNYRWCIDGAVNTRLSTLVRRCIIETLLDSRAGCSSFEGSAELHLAIRRVFPIDSFIVSYWSVSRLLLRKSSMKILFDFAIILNWIRLSL